MFLYEYYLPACVRVAFLRYRKVFRQYESTIGA